ncbi:TetR/AcrR family transcriptional regulator [Bradyrhizobium sp. Cp5.3]|uniref:TetR/AcrR family transcriptional regulator n=1 Tax=Bradyrhizobium sp. Cp5.3 TaxID=443598 RepID=UPI000550458E|nr:TetR/AcrR family transcriptional regulator [Bradyrhizobium sp. Cp5.3]
MPELIESSSTRTRRLIVEAAIELYRQIGHRKTTVLDIARRVSMSPANVYRFFPTKHAIEEAAVAELLAGFFKSAADAVRGGGSAVQRLSVTLNAIAWSNEEILAKDAQLHGLLALAAHENWPVTLSFVDRIRGLLRPIIAAGQASGELRGGSPMAMICCLLEATHSYLDPSRIGTPKLRPSLIEMMNFCADALRQAPASCAPAEAPDARLRAAGGR